jgi:hypothetical protein
MKANGMIRASKNHAFNTSHAGSLEHVVATFNVQTANTVPCVLIWNASQVNYTIDSLHRSCKLFDVGDVSRHDLLADASRRLGCDIGKPYQLVVPLQPFAQHTADVTGSAGNQDPLHELLLYISWSACS